MGAEVHVESGKSGVVPLRAGDPAAIGGHPLEARLGSGGMGTVFLARSASGRSVAVKLIHRHFAEDDEFRIPFRREVAAARRVSGAFTAAVVDADPEAEQPWMATAYIKGRTLAQHCAAEGPLSGAKLREPRHRTGGGAARHPPGRGRPP